MKVSDAMTAEVRTALVNDKVSLVMRIMLGARVSGLPVVDEHGALVGILTEGDLIRRAELGTDRRRPKWLEVALGPRRLAQEYVETHSRRVGDLMTTNVLTIDESAPLADAVDLLEKKHIKRLPVTREGRLVGILSRADLMRAFLGTIPRDESCSGQTDADIRHHIEEEIQRQPWITRSAIQVSVKEGTVDLDGVVTNEDMRCALRVLIENTPGVTRIHDHLVISAPGTGYGRSAPL